MKIPTFIRALCMLAIGILTICTATTRAAAQPAVVDHLEAFLDFEEGAGSTAHDGTGNGHDGTLVGNVTWGNSCAHVHSTGAMIKVDTSNAMRSDSFTYDVWFEANGSSLGGRIIHQAGHVGGEGPDILEWYGKKVSFRITEGSDAVFDAPFIGSRTTSSPPNHLAQTDDSFHIKDGPEHLVFVHDGPQQRVKVFLGLEGQPLKLTFDGTYSGHYSVSSHDLTLGNVKNGERPHPSLFYTFAHYSKALSHTVGSGDVVTGGEVLDNHLAGSSVTMGTVPDPDPGDGGGGSGSGGGGGGGGGDGDDDGFEPPGSSDDEPPAEDGDPADSGADDDAAALDSYPGEMSGYVCNMTARAAGDPGLDTVAMLLGPWLLILARRRRREGLGRRTTVRD